MKGVSPEGLSKAAALLDAADDPELRLVARDLRKRADAARLKGEALSRALKAVQRNAGCTPKEALVALRRSCGSISGAVELLQARVDAAPPEERYANAKLLRDEVGCSMVHAVAALDYVDGDLGAAVSLLRGMGTLHEDRDFRRIIG